MWPFDVILAHHLLCIFLSVISSSVLLYWFILYVVYYVYVFLIYVYYCAAVLA